MFMAKLKLGAAMALTRLVATMTCVSSAPTGVAQDLSPRAQSLQGIKDPGPKGEGDEDFIRRVSRDLRGTEPTPTEVHFFLATKDVGKRQKLIDLLVQERQAKKQVDGKLADKERVVRALIQGYRPVGIRVKSTDMPAKLDSLSRVDILWTDVRQATDMKPVTSVLLEDVLVLVADINSRSESSAIPASVVTMALKPEDYLKVMKAREKVRSA
jgi:hypothetical protein